MSTSSLHDEHNDQVNFFDPFDEISSSLKKECFHLRVQQRSARKNITILEGISADKAASVIHDLKTRLGCSGTYKNNEVHFSGDQRRNIARYLVEKKICAPDEIVVHGY